MRFIPQQLWAVEREKEYIDDPQKWRVQRLDAIIDINNDEWEILSIHNNAYEAALHMNCLYNKSIKKV